MTRIPIITQNFSSPDVFTDTPLMLLPQAPPPALPDRDQEGFSQLLLHDLHRHRQSYIRSFTAFETLKKRQDFVLRQENLRSLQSFEQRVLAKQDQVIDQSIHSYEQCFVKVLNGNSSTHEHQRRPKSAAPSLDKFHMHQLSHTPAMPLDPPTLVPFHRYQKSHRPSVPAKRRSITDVYRSAQSFHDAFQSPSSTNHHQPFQSFTESYLRKYGDQSTSKFQIATLNDGMNDIQEDDEQVRPASAGPKLMTNSTKKQEPRSRTPDLQRSRITISSRNTNTPSSTPQLSYDDALRDGLVSSKDAENNISAVQEKRRSSQQSTSQTSATNDNRISTKRPKTAKKKQVVVLDIPSDRKTVELTTKTTDNDLFKTAMTVQNYGSNATDASVPSKIERLQVPTNLAVKQILSPTRRSSVRSNESSSGAKQSLEHIDTQMTTTVTAVQVELSKEQTNVEQDKDPISPPSNNIIQSTNDQLIMQQQEQRRQSGLEIVDTRKRVKKGAFDASESMNDMVAFELGMLGSQRGSSRKNRFHFGKENHNGDGTEQVSDNQGTLDLLEKIRQSASGVSIGQMPVSQQGCRFELPFDMKLLETLTPLEYLSKYCRLSPRRNHQFKRLFDKYRNNQYRFESNNLYKAIVDLHTDSFTPARYESLSQLIDLGNEQHQFAFDTFAGILALCERLIYDTATFRSGLEEHDLAKDTIEKCDFDSLERKLDGLVVSERMKKLLKTL